MEKFEALHGFTARFLTMAENREWQPRNISVAETDESAGKIIEKDNGWRKTD